MVRNENDTVLFYPKDGNGNYEERLRQLQEKVSSLRMSRRILMSLIDQIQKENEQEVQRLQKEKIRLQRSNQQYASLLLDKNRDILELKKRIQASN